jgi:hypothetical protein
MPDITYIVWSNIGIPMGFDTREEAEQVVREDALDCQIIRESVVGCPTCDRARATDIPHFNCVYGTDWRVGHAGSRGHCTAGACIF